MKVLLVGNARSFLIINLVKKLKEHTPGIRVDIISDQKAFEDHPYDVVYSADNSSPLARMKYVKVLYYARAYKRLLKTISSDYDALHIMYLSGIYRLVWGQMRSKANKKIITVFGSDFYKANGILKSMMEKIAKDVDLVSGSSQKTLDTFCDHFDIAESKRKVCYFGLSVLDAIDSVNDADIEAFRSKYQIQPNATMISCGYNSSKNQNHLEIIEQISQAKSKLDNIVITFQLHNVRSEYTKRIIETVKATGIPFLVFNEYFSDKELAVYRRAVDVCIQLQTTDQFSGAMQEHLYAGCKVITGKWLPYDILDQHKTDYTRIEKMGDLSTAIVDVQDITVDREKNQSIIGSISKWSENIENWKALYQ